MLVGNFLPTLGAPQQTGKALPNREHHHSPRITLNASDSWLPCGGFSHGIGIISQIRGARNDFDFYSAIFLQMFLLVSCWRTNQQPKNLLTGSLPD
jgi:hypothetical protein